MKKIFASVAIFFALPVFAAEFPAGSYECTSPDGAKSIYQLTEDGFGLDSNKQKASWYLDGDVWKTLYGDDQNCVQFLRSIDGQYYTTGYCAADGETLADAEEAWLKKIKANDSKMQDYWSACTKND